MKLLPEDFLKSFASKNQHAVVIGRHYINLIRTLNTLLHAKSNTQANTIILDCSNTLDPRYISTLSNFKISKLTELSIDAEALIKEYSITQILDSLTGITCRDIKQRIKLRENIKSNCLTNHSTRSAIDNTNILTKQLGRLPKINPSVGQLINGNAKSLSGKIVKYRPKQSDTFYWLKLLLEQENMIASKTNIEQLNIYIFDPNGSTLTPPFLSLLSSAFKTSNQKTTINYMTNTNPLRCIGLRNLINRAGILYEFAKSNPQKNGPNGKDEYLKKSGENKQHVFSLELLRIVKQ